MKMRNKLPVDHIKYMPVHRSRDFNREERILIKYVEIMTWYKNENISDPYRQGWRRNVRYRTDGQMGVSNRDGFSVSPRARGLKPKDDRNRQEVTTTLFVPQSADSLLYKLILEKEQQLRGKFNWCVKILESSGTQLLNCFTYKFPIEAGCPRGMECKLCDNKGLKCSTKSVIYQAKCMACLSMKKNGVEDTFKNELAEVSMFKVPTYVGETCRPWRERILEHYKGIHNVKSDSVFVEHWMHTHGLEVECPEFKFEIIGAYSDALRRQIGEAVNIIDKGTLNRKNEFNSNELCRLEPTVTTWTSEEHWRQDLEQRRIKKEKLKNFSDVMINIKKLCNKKKDSSTVDTDEFIYRKRQYSKALLEEASSDGERKKKKRKNSDSMEASTPIMKHREKDIMEDFGSPISSPESGSNGGTSSDLTPTSPKHTAMSGEMGEMLITPVKPESASVEEKKLVNQTLSLTWALADKNIITRTRSLPDLLDYVDNNIFYGKFKRGKTTEVNSPRIRSFSLGSSIDITNWSGKDFDHEDWDVVDKGPTEVDKMLDALELGTDTVRGDTLESEGVSGILSDTCDGKIVEDEVVEPVGVSINSSEACPRGDVNLLAPTDGGIVGNKVVETVGTMNDLSEVCNREDDKLAAPNDDACGVVGSIEKLKSSAIILGIGASDEVLKQPATPDTVRNKRYLNLSPDSKVGRTRKLSIDDRLNKGLRVREIALSEDCGMNGRRNTWSSGLEEHKLITPKRRVLKGGRKTRRSKLVADEKQPLILEVLKREKAEEKRASPQENENCGIDNLGNEDGQ